MKIRGIPVGTTMPRPDWEQDNPKHAAYIKNKPDIRQADWNQADSTKPDYIKNKPEHPQSDWGQTDSAEPDYIKNKPDLNEKLPRVLTPGVDYGTDVPAGGAPGKLFFVEDDTADYVVEQDTKGFWTYRKWASGLVECWLTESVMGWRDNELYYLWSLPVPLLIESWPVVQITTCSHNNANTLLQDYAFSHDAAGERLGTISVTLYDPYIEEEEYASTDVNITITGRWKQGG